MSDYLKNLVARTLDPSSVVQPRLASRFEPHAGAPGTVTVFGLEPGGATLPTAPPFETRSAMRHPDTPTHAERARRIQVEHAPAPPVFERRPDLSSNEEPPAPASERAPDMSPPSQTFMNKETPK